MADMQTALRARLIADGALAAITTQVFWAMVPEKVPLPYIRLQVISDPRPEHLKGYDTARQTRVQVDCFATSYAVTRTMADAVVSAVAAPTTSGPVLFGHTAAEGPTDLGEDVPGIGFIHRASLDLLVEHRLA